MFVPVGGGEQNNTTCQSIEENDDDNKQEDMEEDIHNIDLEDSALSWDMETILYFF